MSSNFTFWQKESDYFLQEDFTYQTSSVREKGEDIRAYVRLRLHSAFTLLISYLYGFISSWHTKIGNNLFAKNT